MAVSPLSKSLLALAAGTFGMCLSEFSMMGMLPAVATGLGVSVPDAGHFISAYAIGVCVGAPATAVLAGSRPPKSVLLILMAVFIAGNLWTALAGSSADMLAARFAAGLPHGAYFGMAAVVADRLTDRARALMALAIVFSGATFANLAGVPGATLIAGFVSWRAGYALVAGAGCLIAAAIALWVPALPGSTGHGRAAFRNQFRFLKSPMPWLLTLAILLGNGGIFCWYSYITPLMTETAGFAPARMPLIMALAGLGMVAGNLLSGKASGRFSPGGIAASTQGLVCLALALTFFLAAAPLPALCLMFVCTASMFALGAPQQMLLIRHSKGGEMLGAALAQVGFNIGNALGAFCGGLTLRLGFGYPATAVTGALLALGGFCALLACRRASERG